MGAVPRGRRKETKEIKLHHKNQRKKYHEKKTIKVKTTFYILFDISFNRVIKLYRKIFHLTGVQPVIYSRNQFCKFLIIQKIYKNYFNYVMLCFESTFQNFYFLLYWTNQPFNINHDKFNKKYI